MIRRTRARLRAQRFEARRPALRHAALIFAIAAGIGAARMGTTDGTVVTPLTALTSTSAPAAPAPSATVAHVEANLDGSRPDGAVVAVRVLTERALRLAPPTLPVENITAEFLARASAEAPPGAPAAPPAAVAVAETLAAVGPEPAAQGEVEPPAIEAATPTPTASPTPEPTSSPTPVPTAPPTPVPPPPTAAPTPASVPTPTPPTPSPIATAAPAPVAVAAAATGRFVTIPEVNAALARTAWPQETWGRVIAIGLCESGQDSDRDGQYDRMDTQAQGAGGLYLGVLQISREHRFRTPYNLLTLADNLNAGYELWIAAGRSFAPWGCA